MNHCRTPSKHFSSWPEWTRQFAQATTSRHIPPRAIPPHPIQTHPVPTQPIPSQPHPIPSHPIPSQVTLTESCPSEILFEQVRATVSTRSARALGLLFKSVQTTLPRHTAHSYESLTGVCRCLPQTCQLHPTPPISPHPVLSCSIPFPPLASHPTPPNPTPTQPSRTQPQSHTLT